MGNSTTSGNCVDGSDPVVSTTCHITPDDIDSTEDGRLFFFESGQVRVLDSSAKVRTIVGQRWSAGDGGAPLSARFRAITWLDMWNNGGTREILAQDIRTGSIREFSSANVRKAMGAPDGHARSYVDLNVSPLADGYEVGSPFAVNGSDGSVYMLSIPQGEQPAQRVLRASRGGAPAWSKVAGHGSTYAYDDSNADAKAGAQINTGLASYGNVLAWQAGVGIFAYLAKPTTLAGADPMNAFFKVFDTADFFRQSHVAGLDNPPGTLFCPEADSSPYPSAAGCQLYLNANESVRPSYDAVNSRWITSRASTDRRVVAFTPGGVAQTVAFTQNNIGGFVYVPDFTGPGQPATVYCESAATGRLFKVDGAGESQLVVLPSGMTCTGKALLYDSTRRSVIFAFLQNQLSGVAEYFLP